jgi:hypothetical protein
MGNNIIKISNIKLKNILINVGCTIILIIILSIIMGGSEPWYLLFIIPFVLQNILGFVLSILLSQKIKVTLIMFFVFVIITIPLFFINSYNLNDLNFKGFMAIISLNFISGLIVFLIVTISNIIIEKK